MASASDLDYSIERAVKHYSSLFVLPSYQKIALLTFLLCIAGGILTIFLVANDTVHLALLFSIFFFFVSIISDLVVRQFFMKADPVYNTRRCAALSMFSILLWFGFLLVGSLLARFYSWSFWGDLFSLGFAAVCILRLLVFSSTSFVSYWKMLGASLTQPIFCLLPMFYVPYSTTNIVDSTIMIAFLLFSILVSVLSARVFIRAINRIGVEILQIPTTTVLKAFLANWMEDLNTPVERLFENFGEEKNIDFSLLGFKVKNRIHSITVVSSFHPGPFKNVGSSLLPFMIQEALAKKLHCVVAVPHGLFGHEFDLASEQQNQEVLRSILNSTDFSNFCSKTTKLVRTKNGVAQASCQLFGECAVVTLTLAPKTTEDFPQEIGEFILKEASDFGFAHTIIINAHNSINSPIDMSSAVKSLKEAALAVLKKASKLKPYTFEIGVAKVVPEEFSFEEGMGPGGICALVIRVDEQTCAYITIDGNNMVSGLREKIFSALKELGVDAGEVLTTDTHVVNAVGKTARGYHPLGEAIPHKKLIEYIKQGVKEALRNMKPASTSWHVGAVPNVRVIGEKQIREMTLLADRALNHAKRIAIPLFTMVGALLIAFLIIF